MSGRGHGAVGDAEDISGLDAAGRLQQHLIWQGDVIEAVSHFSACQQGLVGDGHYCEAQGLRGKDNRIGQEYLTLIFSFNYV